MTQVQKVVSSIRGAIMYLINLKIDEQDISCLQLNTNGLPQA